MIVVGCGAMGAHHARTLTSLPQARLLAIVDKDRKRAELLSYEIGVPAFTELEQALHLSGVEAVVVATPETIRTEPVHTVLAFKKALFLEKPLAANLAEGEKLAEEIARAGVPFQIGFQRRYDPSVLALKKAVEKAGSLEIFRSLTHDPSPPTLEQSLKAGGIVYSTLIHDIDMAHFFGGKIKSVFARGGKLIRDYAHPQWCDTLLVSLLFESGALGVLEASWRTAFGYDSRLEIHSQGGTFFAGFFGGKQKMPFQKAEGIVAMTGALKDQAFIPQSYLERFQEGYRQEMVAFLKNLQEKKELEPGLDAALSALRVADRVACSLQKGQEVFL